MANLDRPRGFECKGVPLRVNKYQSSAACYPGDLIALGTGGQVAPAAAGALILGVCLSYASASGQDVMVADHPDQLIVGQVAGSEIDAQTDIGNTANHIANSPSTTYKMSRHEVDASGLSDSATNGLRILGIMERPNNALGANVEVICAINEHQFGPAIANAGVGV